MCQLIHRTVCSRLGGQACPDSHYAPLRVTQHSAYSVGEVTDMSNISKVMERNEWRKGGVWMKEVG